MALGSLVADISSPSFMTGFTYGSRVETESQRQWQMEEGVAEKDQWGEHEFQVSRAVSPACKHSLGRMLLYHRHGPGLILSKTTTTTTNQTYNTLNSLALLSHFHWRPQVSPHRLFILITSSSFQRNQNRSDTTDYTPSVCCEWIKAFSV